MRHPNTIDIDGQEFISVNAWQDAHTVEWKMRWPNFSPWEFKTRSGALLLSVDMLDKLQQLRKAFGKPLKINSAYRDELHNREVGGGRKSWHMKGVAIDIHIDNIQMGIELENLARLIGFTAVGRYNGVNTKGRFIHLDTRPPKASGKLYQWGSWKIR